MYNPKDYTFILIICIAGVVFSALYAIIVKIVFMKYIFLCGLSYFSACIGFIFGTTIK